MKKRTHLGILAVVLSVVALSGCPKPDGRFEDEALPEPQCKATADCDDGNPCTADLCDPNAHCISEPLDGIAAPIPQESECLDHVCQNGEVVSVPAPASFPLLAQTAGDCQKVVCDGSGAETSIADDTDVPLDGNDCTEDACQGGVPTNPMKAINTACGAGGAFFCDGAGHCLGCTDDSQCSNGGNACVIAVCGADGACGVSPVPSGTDLPAEQQTPQDCKKQVCDGAGNVTQAPDASDVENDGNPCTEDVCNGDTPAHTFTAAGTLCGLDKICDGAGTCGKKTSAPCSGNGQCLSGFCVDGVCCDSSCAGICQACSAAKKGGGEDGTCGAIATGTDPDGDCTAETPASCGNTGFCDGAGACAKYPAGTVCGAASCTGTALNQQDLCNGQGTCVDGGSQSCGQFLCVSATCPSSCVDSSGCAAGAYCGGGVCSAKKQIGGTCASANECLGGLCVDGVCCGTACAGTCMACNVAGFEGTCVNAPFPATDAACSAIEVCNGTGGCKLANGQACVTNIKCASGTCSGSFCMSTTGQPCSTGSECVSAICMNGVCQ